MSQNLGYSEVVELEKYIALKNKAEKIFSDFQKNVRLYVKDYDNANSRFKIWSDAYNACYIQILPTNHFFQFQCRFLHETYNITVTPSGIFDALQNESKGIDHLLCFIEGF